MASVFEAEQIDLRTQTRQKIEEIVALEEPTNIYTNDKYVVTLLSTPCMRKQLAVGWLLSEGILRSPSDIENIVTSESEIKVTTKQPIDKKRIEILGITKLYTTSCGLSVTKFYDIISAKILGQVISKYQIKAKDVLMMIGEIEKRARFFKMTGGTHVSALFEGGELVAFAEDIGRHNTVDKVIGEAALLGSDFSMCVLASSGRQPADMVLKAARLGIPIIISKAAPTRSGIVAAEKTNVTLICFARKYRMNIYSNPDRIDY